VLNISGKEVKGKRAFLLPEHGISDLPALVHDYVFLIKYVTYGCRSQKQDPYNVSIWSPCSGDAVKNLLNTEVVF